MAHAFISYVREDAAKIAVIVNNLRDNGVDLWIDRDSLVAGERWKESIKKAIQTGEYFVAIFSRNRLSKERSVAHDELLVAIEELRLRPYNRRWFIPVRLDDCDIPDIPIGPKETLNSLQRIDFFKDQKGGIHELLRSLQINNPKPVTLQECRLMFKEMNIPSDYKNMVLLVDQSEKCSLRGSSFTVSMPAKFHSIRVQAEVTDVVGPLGTSSRSTLTSNVVALECLPGKLYTMSCNFKHVSFLAYFGGAASKLGIELFVVDISE
jgi:hypothetical protein